MDNTRSRIIAAAARCFSRDGAGNSNMTEIAREAGLTRVTLYRLFVDRAALFHAIIDMRFAAIIDEVAMFIEPISRFDEAIVKGVGHALDLARSDVLLIGMLEHGPGISMDAFLIQLTPEIRERFARFWRPRFEAARKSGELTSSLPNDRLIEGMLTITSPITLRPDFDAADRRRFISDFVIPAILKS
jgi:TetR/AcrR family transcriptional repressor of uid operon